MIYCRTDLIAMKRYRWNSLWNYTRYTLHRSCLPIYGTAIVRLLSFLFLDDFEGNANISVLAHSGFGGNT